MQFTIERATWRCGADGLYRHGEHGTYLCDSLGMMCCLGQVALQLGLTRDEILFRPSPCATENIDHLRPILIRAKEETQHILDFRAYHSDLAKSAMRINDNDKLTRAERESALTTLFTEHGHELTFTGTYTDDAVTTVSA